MYPESTLKDDSEYTIHNFHGRNPMGKKKGVF